MRSPSTELAVAEECQFGDRNQCVLDEILQGQKDLHAGFRSLCRVVKGLHETVNRIECSLNRMRDGQHG